VCAILSYVERANISLNGIKVSVFVIEVILTCLFLWDVAWRRLVIGYERFGKTYRSRILELNGKRINACSWKTWSIFDFVYSFLHIIPANFTLRIYFKNI
jgi:hypothetical protein